MRFEDERYVRLYVRDTTTWIMWSWQARALCGLLLRKVDRAGIMDLGEHGTNGVAAVVGLPVEVVDVGLADMVKSKTVILRGKRLCVPAFMDAQECSQTDRLRKQEQRARARDLASRGVTGGHETGQNVTRGHRRSRAVTPSVPSRAVPNRPERERPARAGLIEIDGEKARPIDGSEPLTPEAEEVAAAFSKESGVTFTDRTWAMFVAHQVERGAILSTRQLLGAWKKWLVREATFATKPGPAKAANGARA